MHGIHLLHDVLDAQLIDRKEEKIGRVDGLELELREGRPPRVAAILVGGEVRAWRIGGWMRLLHHAMQALGSVRGPVTSRIPFRAVRVIGDTVTVDVIGDELDSGRTERWLAEHVIGRIPGGGVGRK